MLTHYIILNKHVVDTVYLLHSETRRHYEKVPGLNYAYILYGSDDGG
jgi:hypothetical protein